MLAGFGGEGRRFEVQVAFSGLPAFDRITSDPTILNGQPCIRGMRLTVRRVLEALATYPNRDELRAEYPELDDEDIRQALQYAAANLDRR